jgi:diaminohydroxyphosphoribosylaminopyrimidine deaminase/5-amino-6-(5-phosphoribosylamino)uracil reductase
MQRCVQLALLGAGSVAPNPMVGAVLVHQNRIIGEGHHQQYGQAHAEVNCWASVKEEDKELIAKSTLYVSLEPCNHFGKTPPCTPFIIEKKIPRVVIGCRDPFKQVNGKGIAALKAAGVEVIENVLEKECRYLNRRFFCFHEQKRPYVVLKWAQSCNGKIAAADRERVFISNEYSNRLVHRWRSEEAAILVGTNTALLDDPSLTNRLWTGKNPIRFVLDTRLKLPASLKIFDATARTVVFNYYQHTNDWELFHSNNSNTIYHYRINPEEKAAYEIMKALHQLNIQSLLVEGGAQLLQSFIDAGYWDEARVMTNNKLKIESGKDAPILKGAVNADELQLQNDRICMYQPFVKNH